MLTYVYDRRGRRVPSSLDERLLAIPLEDLLRVPHRIGVAAGVDKAEATLGALRGGYANVMLLDSALARAVLALG